jgi:hypothetical protein
MAPRHVGQQAEQQIDVGLVLEQGGLGQEPFELLAVC